MLSKKERQVLVALVEQAGHYVTSKELAQKLALYTKLPSLAPEASASANSAISAYTIGYLYNDNGIWGLCQGGTHVFE